MQERDQDKARHGKAWMDISQCNKGETDMPKSETSNDVRVFPQNDRKLYAEIFKETLALFAKTDKRVKYLKKRLQCS